MLNKLLFASFCFLFTLPLVAQEKLVLRTDRDYYIGGEKVWINITNVFNGTNKISDLSNVVYLEISNDQFKPVVQTKFKLDNGMVTSVVPLPDTISTGNYSLRAYTRWMRNGVPEEYTYKTISVVNPFSRNPMPKQSFSNVSSVDSLVIVPKDSAKDISIEVNSNKPDYRKRDEVNLKVKLSGEKRERLKYVTVSVVKSSLLYDDKYHPHQLFSHSKGPKDLLAGNGIAGNADQKILVPEMKGEWITGKITDFNTGVPIVGEQMVLCFLGNNDLMGLSKTNAEGCFHFEVNEYGEKEMIIQPLHKDTANIVYKVTLDPSYSQAYSNVELPEFVLSKEKALEMNKAIVNMQVNTIYSSFLNKVSSKDSIYPKPAFYGKPELYIPLDKFIDLPSIEEVIRELIPEVSLHKHKGHYYLRVLQSGTNIPKKGDVTIMVDGVPVYDLNSVLAIKPSSLDRIEVINLNYYLKDEDLGMLMCFYTKEDNMAGMDLDPRIFRQARNCYHSAYTYHCPDYSLNKLKKSRLADFRNVLYFGTVNMDENGEADLKISTCDDTGQYTIVVVGLDEKGNIHKRISKFEVK